MSERQDIKSLGDLFDIEIMLSKSDLCSKRLEKVLVLPEKYKILLSIKGSILLFLQLISISLNLSKRTFLDKIGLTSDHKLKAIAISFCRSNSVSVKISSVK